jgi:hypothetical protein
MSLILFIVFFTSCGAVCGFLICFVIYFGREACFGARQNSIKDQFEFSNIKTDFFLRVDDVGNESTRTCVICLEDYIDGDVLNLLTCEHAFHKNCLNASCDSQMLTKTCPLCRTPIS